MADKMNRIGEILELMHGAWDLEREADVALTSWISGSISIFGVARSDHAARGAVRRTSSASCGEGTIA